ncbi:hypothetical protein BTTAP_170029 [Brochothrix thermosphacta]|nr:hypothetical protein BTTAP_170029 [Brochothrix thermosphacta]
MFYSHRLMLIFAIKKHYPDKKRQNSVLSNYNSQCLSLFQKNQQAQIAFFIFLQYHCHCTGCFRFYGFPDKERQNSVLSNLFGAKRLLLLSIIPISSVLNRV